ncbi:FRG domain-containing protein [Candidatus Nitrotoga sp. M5]|uniref:FRG domain-containing protein n=1 Tax=Candidatus Nitrotoga sp. M5 TaxID=2890409 RepID=UPI001EF1D1C7|nr:FRG domain-containing protein [Candidatus Nitrotoga sp. M5]
MFAVTRFSSWSELKTQFSDRPLWAYRGQMDSAWPLETTLYREAARNNSLEWKTLSSREDWLLYQFRRFAHHYCADLPPEKDILDWLALIQHYGGPTRLLDFSYSLYVAAFFAVETAVGDAAIWALSLPTLELATYERLGYWPTGSIDEVRRSNNSKFHELKETPTNVQTVIHVEPDRMHERLFVQQGLFLAPTDPNEPFLKNLGAAFKVRYRSVLTKREQKWTRSLDDRTGNEYGVSGYIALVKIILPKEHHREILEDLMSMNISAATLFPGLEGFSRSLRFHV